MKKVIVVLALALGACSQVPGQGREQVASISTPGSAAPTSAPQEERPRERLDMTPEDFEALLEPFKKCMAGLGLTHKGQALPGSGKPHPSNQEIDEATKACESKDPLPPWETDVQNPDALDFATRVVQCLRGKGVRYVEVHNPPGAEIVTYALGGPGNDQQSITLGLEHGRTCEIEASKK